jgi:Kdo2-lipid IVA lauroyltransferase/acyltransferase
MKYVIDWAFRFFGFFGYYGGPKVRHLMGAVIGLLWYDIFRVRRSVVIENLMNAYPDMSRRQAVSIGRQSMFHMGECLVEYGNFPYISKTDLVADFEIEGREHLDRALSQGLGVYLLTLHIGNGDLASVALGGLGLKIHLISKEFKNRALNDSWFGMRSRHGTKFISPQKSSFQVLRAIGRNEIVVFVLDQFMGPPFGVATNFFGRRTGTAAGLATMAQRSRSPVIPVYTVRLPDGRHKIVFQPEVAWVAKDTNKASEVEHMTQVYTSKIESIVRMHPEQWMWIHRRWKEFEHR